MLSWKFAKIIVVIRVVVVIVHGFLIKNIFVRIVSITMAVLIVFIIGIRFVFFTKKFEVRNGIL